MITENKASSPLALKRRSLALKQGGTWARLLIGYSGFAGRKQDVLMGESLLLSAWLTEDALEAVGGDVQVLQLRAVLERGARLFESVGGECEAAEAALAGRPASSGRGSAPPGGGARTARGPPPAPVVGFKGLRFKGFRARIARGPPRAHVPRTHRRHRSLRRSGEEKNPNLTGGRSVSPRRAAGVPGEPRNHKRSGGDLNLSPLLGRFFSFCPRVLPKPALVGGRTRKAKALCARSRPALGHAGSLLELPGTNIGRPFSLKLSRRARSEAEAHTAADLDGSGWKGGDRCVCYGTRPCQDPRREDPCCGSERCHYITRPLFVVSAVAVSARHHLPERTYP
eukprot:1191179-Prorocentrum_minimum.AAC.1